MPKHDLDTNRDLLDDVTLHSIFYHNIKMMQLLRFTSIVLPLLSQGIVDLIVDVSACQ